MPEVLTAPRVITGDETVAGGAVVVGDRTVELGRPAAALPAEYAALPRADYPHSTILPGLIDSHVHLGLDGGPEPVARMRAETDEQQLILMLHSARDLLGVGVTSARDLGGRGYLTVAVRDAIASGLARGPRLVVAASPVTVTGGHCWFMGAEADSEDELRRLVRTHHKHGADLIKVMATGGFMTSGSAPWYAQFTTAQLALIVAEARRVDKPVAAHAHGTEGIRRAVAAGVTTIEHCSFVTETNERRFDEQLAAMLAEQGIFVCPTIKGAQTINTLILISGSGVVSASAMKASRSAGRWNRAVEGATDVSVLVQEGTGLRTAMVTLFRRPEELGQQCPRAGLAQVQDGRQTRSAGASLRRGPAPWARRRSAPRRVRRCCSRCRAWDRASSPVIAASCRRDIPVSSGSASCPRWSGLHAAGAGSACGRAAAVAFACPGAMV